MALCIHAALTDTFGITGFSHQECVLNIKIKLYWLAKKGWISTHCLTGKDKLIRTSFFCVSGVSIKTLFFFYFNVFINRIPFVFGVNNLNQVWQVKTFQLEVKVNLWNSPLITCWLRSYLQAAHVFIKTSPFLIFILKCKRFVPVRKTRHFSSFTVRNGL